MYDLKRNTIWTHVNNVHGNFHIDIFKIFSFYGRKCKGIKYQNNKFGHIRRQGRTKSINSTHFYYLDDPAYFLMSIKKN